MNTLAPENKAYLYSIGTAVPGHQLPQDDIKRFMIQTARSDLPESESEPVTSFIRTIYDNSEIRRRHSTISDFGASSPDEHTFFPPAENLEPLPTTGDRMEKYEEEAPVLAEKASRRALRTAQLDPRDVTHLVYTSCTGHFAPGPDTKLIEKLGLSRSVRRIQIGFMGCYAGFNTLRTAAEIVRGQPAATVLLVCLELCTLHFQKDFSRNGIVSDCLFSDGCAASVVGGSSCPADAPPRALLGPSHCRIDTDQQDRMTWRIANHGFNMFLDPDIPEQLKPHVKPFVKNLRESSKKGNSTIDQWAIHPGGSKILNVVAEVLGLSAQRLEPSRSILQEFGNMSSPTILFILNRLLGLPSLSANTCALGFGPGLALEGLLLFPPDTHQC